MVPPSPDRGRRLRFGSAQMKQMNKNGLVAMVVAVAVVVLAALWLIQGGASRPGSRQFDCTAPPNAPRTFTHTLADRVATGVWQAPGGTEPIVNYVLEVGSTSGASNEGVITVPGNQTSYTAPVKPGPIFARVYARNACGMSPSSNEISFTVP